MKCYHRFDLNYLGNFQQQDQARTSQVNSHGGQAYVANTNSDFTPADNAWYVDSGASTHVIVDLNTLTQRIDYKGKEKLVVGNSSKLNISHIGYAIIPAKSASILHLKNILHVPQITKNLLSISH